MTPEEMKQIAEMTAAIVTKNQAAATPAPAPAPAKVEEPLVKLMGAPAPSDVKVGKDASEGTGINLGRYLRAKAVAKLHDTNPASVAKAWGYDYVAKALSTSDFANGGSLVHPQFAGEFIELLRNQAVIRKAGARVLPMGASLTFDGQTGAASAAYQGSTTAASTSNPTSGQPLVLSEKKLVGLVPVPNDLIRNANASISAEEWIRNDLVQVMALTEDLKFLYGSGSAFEPKGLQSQLKSANKYAMTALGTANKPTIGELKLEINKAKKTMKKANAPMRSLFWVMSPTVEAGIKNAVGPGGEGYNAYEREMNEKGTLAGYPYYVTNQITESTSADLFLFDASEIIIGESMGLELEFFPNSAFSQSGSVVSGISTDQSVFRAIAKHDIGLRHDVSGINVTGVTYGF
jgi:HK97 family phage major capsid protein